MSLPTYPAYKDSDVAWLGEVPEHWEVKRLRFVAQLNPSKSETNKLDKETEVSFLPMEVIGDDGSLNLERTRPIIEVETGYTYFREGDVTFAKITPCFENGKGAIMYGLIGGIGFGTTELIVARPKQFETTSNYLHYLFVSKWFRKLGEASMYGAGGQKRVPDDFVRNFVIGFPPVKEQQTIATFLDRETAKIDALIAEQQQLIELLKEKRQAVISHAVTKGLNPDAPMKDSGIEWLGEVPEHWVQTPIKHALNGIIDTEHKTAPFFEGGEYLVVRTTNIKNGKLILDGAKYTDLDGYIEWTRRGVPNPGDILFTREAPAGEACIVPDDRKLCVGQRTVTLQVNHATLNSRFALWSLYGGISAKFIADLSQGSTVAHFNMSDIGNIPIMLPQIEEQSTIAIFLDQETAKIDELIAEAQRAIELLKERRTALISAAVTGKIDVRGLVADKRAV
jgi:type I restriction enzyme S subunit